MGWDSFPEILTDIPRRAVYFLILSPVLLFLIGIGLPPISTGNARSVLMVLGGALASVLAIVFSVAILGIQLVATRYTARATSLFAEDSIFQFTFGIFVAAVGLDILALMFLPAQTSNLLTGVLLSIVGINMAAVVFLYYFIQSSAKLNTPEGILRALDSKLTPDRYRDEVKQYLEKDVPHPLHAAYGMAVSAMSNQESATAEQAVKKIRTVTLRVIRDLYPEEGRNDTTTKQLFEPVLEDFLPEIAVSATERGEDTVSRRAVSAEADLLEAGVETKNEFVPSIGMNGYANILRELEPVEESYGLIQRVFKRMSKLVTLVAEKPAPSTTGHMLLRIRSHVDRLFRWDLDVWVYREILREYFDNLEDVQKSLLDEHGEDVAGQGIDWRSKGLVGEYDARNAAEALNYVNELVVKATNSCLSYKLHEDEEPFTAGNFRGSWKAYCVQAANSPVKEYGIAWIQCLIEVSYCFYLFDSDNQGWWARAVADVMSESNPELVEEAFNRIFESENYSRRIRIRQPTLEVEEKSLLQQAVQEFTSPPGFQEWAQQFQEDVYEQYTSLLDRQD